MGRDTLDSIRKLKELKAAREASGKRVSEHLQPVLQSTGKRKTTLKEKLMQPVITGIVRHLLTALGGGLVGDGLLDQDQLNGGIGAVVLLVTIGWSVYTNKKNAAKAK